MVHTLPESGRRHYGPGFTPGRHNDRGDPSSPDRAEIASVHGADDGTGSYHPCLKGHGISRLPEIEDTQPRKKQFERFPIGYFHVDLAEVRTAEGKLYLFVAIDRTSKFTVY